MKNDIIEELLNDLIAKCEGHMTSPFKKKSESVVAVIEPEEAEEEPEVEVSADKPEEDDVDDETMQKLIEAYKKSK